VDQQGLSLGLDPIVAEKALQAPGKQTGRMDAHGSWLDMGPDRFHQHKPLVGGQDWLGQGQVTGPLMVDQQIAGRRRAAAGAALPEGPEPVLVAAADRLILSGQQEMPGISYRRFHQLFCCSICSSNSWR